MVKQIPQIRPSGQVTRAFATWRPHRSQTTSPVLRGRPRPRLAVSVAMGQPGTNRFDAVGDLGDVGIGCDLPGRRGSERIVQPLQ